MANLINFGTFYPNRLSEYVPAMQYSADLQLNNNTRISFGAPLAANGASMLNAQSINAAGVLSASALLNNGLIDTPFGRQLVIQLGGAGTGSLIVDGFDYLNQPMSESIAYNGNTIVGSKKAFKRVRQVTFTAVAAGLMNLGIGGTLGLPYKTIKVYTEELNGVPASIGALTNFDTTVPATLTTGDTRGTYTPASTLNGTNVITATFDFTNDVDANNNGGLHGVPHYTN